MLEAICDLPADEQEAFDLVRIQGMTYPEAAEVLAGLFACTPVKFLLDCGEEALEGESSIVTLAVDEEGRRAVDSRAHPSEEICPNPFVIGIGFENLEEFGPGEVELVGEFC